jgi:hypothetical protein
MSWLNTDVFLLTDRMNDLGNCAECNRPLIEIACGERLIGRVRCNRWGWQQDKPLSWSYRKRIFGLSERWRGEDDGTNRSRRPSYRGKGNSINIQAALDKGGNVVVPDGVYLVDITEPLRVRSDTTLILSKDVVLKAKPTDKAHYSILMISGVKNVSVVGGTIQGERNEHKGDGGEWGFGIRISEDAEGVTISNVTTKDCWGDGIYINGAKGVLVDQVVSDNNRRQGLSVIRVDTLAVVDSIFRNTNGTRPAAGIDLEPNKGELIKGVTITGCQLLNNEGAGIKIAGKKGTVTNVKICNNIFKGNRPLKIGGIPGADKYQPDLWSNFKGKVLGSWSDYKNEATIA